MSRDRRMLTQYWPYTEFYLVRHNPVDPRSRACHGRITLDGITYGCTRAVHTGAHDAGEKHHDGGLVRW